MPAGTLGGAGGILPAGGEAAGGGGLSSDVSVKATSGMAGFALRLFTSLTSAVFGSETSKLQIFLDKLGTLVPALDIRPDQTQFPQGSAAAPSVSFQGNSVANGTGMFYSFALSGLVWAVNGIQVLIATTGGFTCQQDTALFTLGSISQGFIGLINTFNVLLGSTAGNAQLGVNGALATNATIGFVDFPTCAGAPSGTPSKTEAGHRSMIYDTTNHKIWFFDGTWKGVVIA